MAWATNLVSNLNVLQVGLPEEKKKEANYYTYFLKDWLI